MQNRAAGRRARGEIEQLPSGSLRVRVYLGIDAATGKRRYLQRTVPAGPMAQQQAEAARAALLSEVAQRRRPEARGEEESQVVAGPPTAASPTEPAMTRPNGGPPRGGSRGMLTVAGIARLAGVSAPTVSKVLNGRADVAPQTRSRVEAALREHGYRRPEYVTRAATIDVVFYGMQSNMAIAIMHGVEQVAGENRMTVSFTNVARQVQAGRSWAHDLLARRPTGVIAVHLGYPSEHHGLLTASAIPVVALDPTGEPEHPVPSVGATNWSGGIAATRHLLDLGHRRIGVIAGPMDRLSARARLEGARAAMEAEGVTLPDELVRQGRRFAFEDGVDLGQELLELADPPTAILCGNDLQALGVYEAARRARVRIPDDLSVVGFDGVSFTQWCGPPMTTVRQPLAEMGATAAEMVLSLAAGRPLAQTRVELATSLIVRESTASPRRA